MKPHTAAVIAVVVVLGLSARIVKQFVDGGLIGFGRLGGRVRVPSLWRNVDVDR